MKIANKVFLLKLIENAGFHDIKCDIQKCPAFISSYSKLNEFAPFFIIEKKSNMNFLDDEMHFKCFYFQSYANGFKYTIRFMHKFKNWEKHLIDVCIAQAMDGRDVFIRGWTEYCWFGEWLFWPKYKTREQFKIEFDFNS